MKQILLIIVFSIVGTLSVSAQRDVYAFKAGEKLVYRVFYSSAIVNATAGEAMMTIKKDQLAIPGSNKREEVLKITGTGYSKGLFDFFYPVRDTFESYINPNTVLPYKFKRATHEGGYNRSDLVYFFRDSLKAKNSRKVIDIPPDLHDMLSALYYMRLADVESFNKDSMYVVNFYLDDSVYHSAIKFLGRDTVKTGFGNLPVLKFAPMMATGEVFAKKYPMFVWVSDDKNHVPVLASSEVIVGSIKMELVNYENLKNPLVKPVRKKRKRRKNR